MKPVREKLILLFAIGVLLLNFPLLAIFNHPTTLAGIPTLYVYLFLVWALGIGAVLALARGRWDGEG